MSENLLVRALFAAAFTSVMVSTRPAVAQEPVPNPVTPEPGRASEEPAPTPPAPAPAVPPPPGASPAQEASPLPPAVAAPIPTPTAGWKQGLFFLRDADDYF